MSVMVEAFDETVQGERAYRDAEHLELLDELIAQGPGMTPELAGLNILGDRDQVIALAKITAPHSGDPGNLSRRCSRCAVSRLPSLDGLIMTPA